MIPAATQISLDPPAVFTSGQLEQLRSTETFLQMCPLATWWCHMMTQFIELILWTCMSDINTFHSSTVSLNYVTLRPDSLETLSIVWLWVNDPLSLSSYRLNSSNTLQQHSWLNLHHHGRKAEPCRVHALHIGTNDLGIGRQQQLGRPVAKLRRKELPVQRPRRWKIRSIHKS